MDVNNEYGFLELHISLLKLLEVFHDKCVQNGIKYSLGYGSMLGAIRHRGIIPWDDDIDIIVNRENYNKLIDTFLDDPEVWIERNNKSTLWIDRIRFRNKMEFPYAPTIDVFIIDNVPDNIIVSSIKKNLILFVQGMIKLNFFVKKGSCLEKVASFISSMVGLFFSYEFKLRIFQKVSTIGNKKMTRKVANYNVEYIYVRKEYGRGIFDNLQEMPFDSGCAYVTDKYDSCLSTLYGDYMTPPVDKSPKHYIKNQS